MEESYFSPSTSKSLQSPSRATPVDEIKEDLMSAMSSKPGSTDDSVQEAEGKLFGPQRSMSRQLPLKATLPPGKKRSREDSPSISSDSPIFSSDTPPSASAENFIKPRSKRQHRRPWFEADDLANLIKVVEPILNQAGQLCAPDNHLSKKLPIDGYRDRGVWRESDVSVEINKLDSHGKSKHLRVIDYFKTSRNGDFEFFDDVYSICQKLDKKRHQALLKRAEETLEDPSSFEGPVFPYWQKQPDGLGAYHLLQETAQLRILRFMKEGKEYFDFT